jgi:hypothetical protein
MDQGARKNNLGVPSNAPRLLSHPKILKLGCEYLLEDIHPSLRVFPRIIQIFPKIYPQFIELTFFPAEEKN